MSTDCSAFEQSLSSVDVDAVRVKPDGVADAIEDMIDESAVGVPLGREAWSMPDGVDVDPTPAALEDALTGVTPAAFAIEDYGTIILPVSADGSELVSLYVHRHVAVIDERDIVADMEAAFDRFGDAMPAEFGSAILATGPSATADMGSLVKGAHGPCEVALVIVEA